MRAGRGEPEEPAGDLKTQELFKRVRSLLNKLTPQMFQPLMKQVTELQIDTEERLKGVTDLIFEKAISEPNFSVAYTNMCRCLMGVGGCSCCHPRGMLCLCLASAWASLNLTVEGISNKGRQRHSSNRPYMGVLNGVLTDV